MNKVVNQNKSYWDEQNSKYSNTWKSKAKSALSDKEMGFITNYLLKFKPVRILDIGVGNGRVLGSIIYNSTNNAKVYGIDISGEMVNICKEKFANNKKIENIRVCNISTESLPFKEDFDLITAMRVLNYNENWKEIIGKIYERLNPGGVFIFTMPNHNSINRFSRHKIPVYDSTIKEINHILASTGFKGLEICSYSKLPDIFYYLSGNKVHLKLLFAFENIVEKIIGNKTFGRILFYSVQRP